MSYRLQRGAVTHLDAILSISVAGGGGAVVAGTLSYIREVLDTPGTTSIPAGAYKILVINTGLKKITVDGRDIPPGENFELEKSFNHVSRKQDFCPAVDIVIPADGVCSYLTIFPS